jgi:hypothetical protein
MFCRPSGTHLFFFASKPSTEVLGYSRKQTTFVTATGRFYFAPNSASKSATSSAVSV